MYYDKLDDIVNKYNNSYHRTIKMKPDDVKLGRNLMMKILNLKLMILLEYQNIKTLFQIGLKKFLLLQKLKILFCGLMLLVILTVKRLLERSMKKNCKKQIKKSLELKKQ